MIPEYEFVSKTVVEDHGALHTVEKACNALAQEGFEVFSVLCPDPDNYSTFKLTAKRRIRGTIPLVGRKFR
jgi:hypothetical protein